MVIPGSSEGLFGLAVAANGTHIAAAAPYRTVDGMDEAGAVEITDPQGNPLFTLTSPNPEAGAHFGAALAMGKDFLVVSAPHADHTGTDSGVVYVFDFAGQLIHVPIANPGSSLYFGTMVALSRQSTVVVSATGPPGSLYRLELSTGTIDEVLNPQPSLYPVFGSSMATTQDGDLLVSALDPDTFTAAVFRFSRTGQLLASSEFAETNGLSVYALADGDAVVGIMQAGDALQPAASAPDAGIAIVGSPDGGTAVRLDPQGIEVGRYLSPNGAGPKFGCWSAMVGPHLAIGSPSFAGGSVYLCDADTGALRQKITAPEGAEVSEFGYAVAGAGDDLVIGAPAHSSFGSTEPSVYLLRPATEACGRPLESFTTVMLGTEASEELVGTAGDDLIVLFGGSDSARGKGGNDCILGGEGADELYGGGGDADFIDGGPGEDLCHAELYVSCEI